jgi:hypothetical protein
MPVSQKTSDFDPAMRSTRTISILFRRKYEGNLGAIARTIGNRTSGVIPKLMRGLGTVHFPLKAASFCGKSE